TVLRGLRKWIKCDRLRDLRSAEHALDDRVPEILLTLRQPTFVTIDHHFSHPSWCHPRYCILYFALRDREQRDLPRLLRELLRLPGFRTRAARMGSWPASVRLPSNTGNIPHASCTALLGRDSEGNAERALFFVDISRRPE